MASGLMDFLKSPAFGTYISGLGQGLVRADQGQGFDMGETPQLMAQMMAKRKQQEKMRGLMEALGDQLTPEQKQWVQAVGPETAMPVLGKTLFQEPQRPGFEGTGMRQQAYNVLMDPNSSEREKQAARHYFEQPTYDRHPVTGKWIMREGTVPQFGGAQAQSALAGQQGAVPQTGSPAPSAGQRVAQEPAFGEGPGPQGDADYTGAFGLEGVLKNWINTGSDFLAGTQLFPDSATAKRSLENVAAQTSALLAQGVETRGGKYLLDRFDEIQARAGGIQGPEDAMKTTGEILELLKRSHQINQNIAQSEVRPKERSDATAMNRRLEPIIQEYEQIHQAFAQQYQGGGDIPTVQTPEEARQLPSGTRFRDPNGVVRVVP